MAHESVPAGRFGRIASFREIPPVRGLRDGARIPPPMAAPVVYHVRIQPTLRWTVLRDGTNAGGATYPRRDAAVAYGRRLCGQARPCRLVIHLADGTIEKEEDFPVLPDPLAAL